MLRHLRLLPLILVSAWLAGLATEPPVAAASSDDSPPPAWLGELSDGSQLDLPQLDPAIPAPHTVLGHSLGSSLSHWATIRDYFTQLATASDRVTTWSYGSTYEDRPLLLAAISSPGNLARLEEIRRHHLVLAQPADGSALAADDAALDEPVIVWLGYGVHGNEASSPEAAMAVAYILAAQQQDPGLLENLIVLIDPLINPDGHERYVHFYETYGGRIADPFADSAEHREIWPGGRQNHYLVDLNRDWAWGSQQETQHRLAEYRRWEPQVVVDLHEMSPDATYFFPPAAAPVHDRIDERVVAWLERFGRANAAAFDQRGWLYFSGENFDLFYPGYGDSYPSLRGAVGMTYEVSGGGRAGIDLTRPDGSRLTLSDRIARHITSSLATVKTTAENRRGLLADFATSRREPFQEPARTYLWAADQPEASWTAATLEQHGIEIGRLSAPTEMVAQPVTGGPATNHRFSSGTWTATTQQPLGDLLRSLMDLDWPLPEEFLEAQRRRVDENRSPRFFDITTWSLPLAANLDAWIVDGPVNGQVDGQVGDLPAFEPLVGDGGVGFLVPPSGLAGYRLAAGLLARGRRFRLAMEPFTSGGFHYAAGTLFVPRVGNPTEVEQELEAVAIVTGIQVRRTATSQTEEGISLGSESMPAIRPARLGLVGGEGIDVTSFGAIWHLLDRQLEAPFHRLGVRDLGSIDLTAFEVLVLPSGDGYDASLDEAAVKAITNWVEGGGLLVGVGSAIDWLRDNDLSSVAVRDGDETGDDIEAADGSGEATDAALEPGRSDPTPGESLDTPGAAIHTVLSPGHPLAIGLPRPPRVLIRGATFLEPSGDPQRDLLRVAAETPIAAGFAWPEAIERLAGSLLIGTEKKGEGTVVSFLPAPCFRLFWRATTPLFLNAVIYGPSLQDKGLM